MMISSKQNPKIKELRALHTRKGRQEIKKFLVEGIRPVSEALSSGARLDSVFYAPDLLESVYARGLIPEVERTSVPCFPVSVEVFESIADKENPQGILAVAHTPVYFLSNFDPSNLNWGVALLAPQDPGNIGTILRTIDAVGADGLILLDDPETRQFSAEAVHPGAVRASMGTIFWIPVIKATFSEFSDWSRRLGYTLYGTSAHASQDYRKVLSYDRPAILFMGSEQKGLNQEQLKICNHLLSLPMHGHATSLNLAVAAGVFLYAMLEK
jgi:TrmH family RNA methyltransferase